MLRACRYQTTLKVADVIGIADGLGNQTYFAKVGTLLINGKEIREDAASRTG
jgi:hypothetical protein